MFQKGACQHLLLDTPHNIYLRVAILDMETLDNLNAYKVACDSIRLYLVVSNLSTTWCAYSLTPYALHCRLALRCYDKRLRQCLWYSVVVLLYISTKLLNVASSIRLKAETCYLTLCSITILSIGEYGMLGIPNCKEELDRGGEVINLVPVTVVF